VKQRENKTPSLLARLCISPVKTPVGQIVPTIDMVEQRNKAVRARTLNTRPCRRRSPGCDSSGDR
jgi:hypothetical protein